MAERTVGVQLIIFGKQRVEEDLAGVLDDVAAAGYQAVGLAGRVQWRQILCPKNGTYFDIGPAANS